jgi:hypothetical protein
LVVAASGCVVVYAARFTCLIGLGVRVRTGCATRRTERRARLSGFGAKRRQRRPMTSPEFDYWGVRAGCAYPLHGTIFPAVVGAGAADAAGHAVVAVVAFDHVAVAVPEVVNAVEVVADVTGRAANEAAGATEVVAVRTARRATCRRPGRRRLRTRGWERRCLSCPRGNWLGGGDRGCGNESSRRRRLRRCIHRGRAGSR